MTRYTPELFIRVCPTNATRQSRASKINEKGVNLAPIAKYPACILKSFCLGVLGLNLIRAYTLKFVNERVFYSHVAIAVIDGCV
jgi:hypothetical protein